MKLLPQIELTFNGQCRDAFAFYERALGGSLTFMLTWGESPAAGSVPAEWADTICHATVKIGEGVIMGGDAPGEKYERPRGFSIVLQMDDAAEAERVFYALAEGGSVVAQLEATFWASRYGALIDRFGVPWTINCG